MYEIWYDYVKPKYKEKDKLCHTDTNSSTVYIKTEDFFSDIAKDVEAGFDTSIYDKIDHFIKEKKEKVIELMNNEKGGKVTHELVGLIAKA